MFRACGVLQIRPELKHAKDLPGKREHRGNMKERNFVSQNHSEPTGCL